MDVDLRRKSKSVEMCLRERDYMATDYFRIASAVARDSVTVANITSNRAIQSSGRLTHVD